MVWCRLSSSQVCSVWTCIGTRQSSDVNVGCNAHFENCFIPGGTPGLKQSHLREYLPVLGLAGHIFSHCIVDLGRLFLKWMKGGRAIAFSTYHSTEICRGPEVKFHRFCYSALNDEWSDLYFGFCTVRERAGNADVSLCFVFVTYNGWLYKFSTRNKLM